MVTKMERAHKIMFNDKNLFDFYDVMGTQKRSDFDLNSKYSACSGKIHVRPTGKLWVSRLSEPGGNE